MYHYTYQPYTTNTHSINPQNPEIQITTSYHTTKIKMYVKQNITNTIQYQFNKKSTTIFNYHQ
jgi:hypothetical protein